MEPARLQAEAVEMLCQQGVNGKQSVSCRVVVLDHAAYNALDSTKTCMAASVWTCPCHKPSFLFLIARSPDPGLSHAWQLWGLHLPAASNKDTKSHAESASMLVMQDMDVETLMQEIKQWGPQDQGQAPQVQAQAPQEGAIMNEPDSQSPGRLSLDKTDQPSSSSVQVDTPDHSQTQVEEEEEASSSSDKASLQSREFWSFLCDMISQPCVLLECATCDALMLVRCCCSCCTS